MQLHVSWRLGFVLYLDQGLKLAASRMILFGPSLRIKMKIFESIGMLLSERFLQKIRCDPVSPRLCFQRPPGKLSLR